MIQNKTRDAIIKKFGNFAQKHDDNRQHNMNKLDMAHLAGNRFIKTTSIESTSNETTSNAKIPDMEYRAIKLLKLVEVDTDVGDCDICIYSIITKNNKPYIMFNLQKEKDILIWPSTKKEKVQQLKNIIHVLKNTFTDENLAFQGVFTYNNRKQLWFQYDMTEHKIEETFLNKNKLWCLISEIVNSKRYLNIKISSSITEFFLKYSEFIYLYNKAGEVYEIPTVGYYGNYYKKILLAAGIGLQREQPAASLGSYYYFGSYERAMRYSIWTSVRKPMKVNGTLITIDENGKYSHGGLVRFCFISW